MSLTDVRPLDEPDVDEIEEGDEVLEVGGPGELQGRGQVRGDLEEGQHDLELRLVLRLLLVDVHGVQTVQLGLGLAARSSSRRKQQPRSD